MAPPTLGSLLRDLQAAFPERPLTAETAALYARELADVPLAVLEPAVRELIRTSGAGDYFPRIGEIRKVAAERVLGLPSSTDALAQVDARIAWGASREGDPPAVHPLVVDALDRVGGYASYRMADKPSLVRAQFLNLYRELRAEAIRGFAVGPALASPPERKALERGPMKN